MLQKSIHLSLFCKSLARVFIAFLLGTFSVSAVAQNNRNTSNIYTPQNNQAENGKGFSGFYTQAGLGYQNFTPSYSSASYSSPAGATAYGNNISSSSASNLTGSITAGYDFSVSPTFLLGVGADLSPISGKSTRYGGGTANSTTIPASTYKVNNSYNLFLSPVIPLDKFTTIYGKVGYSKLQTSAGPNLNSVNYSGYSLGLGYKTIVSGSIFAYVEGNYFNYGKASDSGSAIIPSTSTSYSYANTSNASSYNLLYGLGVRF
jgi:hypothetical protein